MCGPPYLGVLWQHVFAEAIDPLLLWNTYEHGGHVKACDTILFDFKRRHLHSCASNPCPASSPLDALGTLHLHEIQSGCLRGSKSSKSVSKAQCSRQDEVYPCLNVPFWPRSSLFYNIS